MMQWLVVILSGLIAGMLVNYLADVLPWRRRFVHPFCTKCGTPQPALNYLVWPRRCAHCGARRVFRAYWVELAYIFISIYLWNSAPGLLGYTISLTIMAYLGLVAIIDGEHRLILHPVSLVGAGLALATGIWLHGIRSTLIGGAAGFGMALLIYYFGIGFIRLMNRLRGKAITETEGIGFGDVNLSGVIGLLLGWPGVWLGLLLAVFLAGGVNLIYLAGMIVARKYSPELALPYGPFLAASAAILLYFKDAIYALLGW